MNMSTTTYEVVGDFLKVSDTGGIQDPKTTFNYIKNGNIEITGPIETPKSIAILGSTSDGKIVINTSGIEHYNKRIYNYVPDLSGFVQNLMRVIGITAPVGTGIRGVRALKGGRKTRRRV
jgi:hypothetical protein